MRRVIGVGLMAAVMAAFSLSAFAQQQCQPTPVALQWLAANGWEYHDALVAPSGVAFTLYCRGEAGLLIGHPPDGGASCLITAFLHGCMAVLEPAGTES